MGAPYYGAYFVAAALAGADKIAMLDAGKSSYAVYAIYNGQRPVRLVLYNSDYYIGGTRGTYAFIVDGLGAVASVRARRLTAPAATSRQDRGGDPTFAGLGFANATCDRTGTEKGETVVVSGGKATFSVGASEALLVDL